MTAWSPDGKFFIAGTSLGVYVFDAQTLDEIHFIEVKGGVGTIAISPDSKFLATGNDRVDLWNIETKENIGILTGTFKGYISYLSFSPDGYYIGAVGSEGGGGSPSGSLRVWQTSNRALLYAEEAGCGYGSSFSFNPAGQTLALQTCGFISIKDVKTGKDVISFTDEIMSHNIVYTFDGKSIIAGISSYSIGLINIESQKIERSFAIDGFTGIVVSPEGRTMAILDIWDDRRGLWVTDIWDIKTGQRRFVIDDDHYGISFNADGRELSAINKSGDLEFWDVETGTLVKTLEWTKIIDCLSFGNLNLNNSTSSPLLLAGNDYGQIALINPDTGEMIQTIRVSELPVTAVAIHPNGYLIGASVFDNDVDNESTHVIIYDLRTKQLINEMTIKRQYPITGLAFSLDGKSIAAKLGTFHEIQAWNIYSDDPLTDPAEKIWYNGMEVDADMMGHLIDLEFNSSDETYKIIDTYTDQILAPSLPIKETGICQDYENYSMSFDSRYFALGCDLQTLPIWDLRKQTLAYNFQEHEPVSGDGFFANITDVSFSPYGYLLASSGYDDMIRFWDINSGQLLLTLNEHSCTVNDIAFSVDGSYLASSSCDGTLRLWGLPR